MNLADLEKLVAGGESNTVELKKSTAQLRRAAETLCAMLNGNGGKVLIGVTPGGRIVGQEISDKTLREVADVLGKFEPPATITQTRIDIGDGKEVLMLEAVPNPESRPYAFDGRPFQRVGSTTSVLPRETYQQLLTERAHSRARWENQPAREYDISELDHEEILRTVRLGIAAGRLPESTGSDVPDILERLELFKKGSLNNAAVVLFGTRFMPDYPQCQLRMARFRGVDKSEFLDQRQLEGHAFTLLDEAMLFLRRHLPVAGRIVPGLFEREDEPLFPLEALREALVNAFCHRDYTIPGGAVAVAMYDDHLEITNPGVLHFGITPEKLTKPHESKPWNPIIANVFYRAGIIERWGTGTLNIIDWCRENSNPPPSWQEQADSVYVTFLPAVLPATPEVTPPVTPPVTQPVKRLLNLLSNRGDMGARAIREALGLKDRTHTRDAYISPALHEGLIEYTIPQKPTSRLQKYHLTKKGTKWLENATSAD